MMETKTIETTTGKEFISEFKRECHSLSIPQDLIHLFLLCLKPALKASEWNIAVSFFKNKHKSANTVLILKRSVTGEWAERNIASSKGRYTISVKPGSHTTVFATPRNAPLPAKAA